MLPRRLGIYGYFCLITGMVYVGQGKNIWKRARDHEKGLARGTHHCTYLQNAWNKYGSENFEWRVIELCSCEGELTEREQHWINHYNGTVGIYNIANPVRQRVPSERMSQAHSKPETVARVSKKALARWSDDEFRADTQVKIDAFWESQEGERLRQEHAQRANKQWEDENHRAIASAKRKERWQDEAYAKERSDGTRALWEDREYRSKVVAAVTETCNKPDYLAGLRERTKQQWAARRAAGITGRLGSEKKK